MTGRGKHGRSGACGAEQTLMAKKAQETRSERKVKEFKNKKEIHVSEKTIPSPVETFQEVGLFLLLLPLMFSTNSVLLDRRLAMTTA
jgi:hypothetical protein